MPHATHYIPHAKLSVWGVKSMKKIYKIFLCRNLAFIQCSSQFSADIFVHYKSARHKPSSMLDDCRQRWPSSIQHWTVFYVGCVQHICSHLQCTAYTSQCHFNVGPASQAVAQHRSRAVEWNINNAGSMLAHHLLHCPTISYTLISTVHNVYRLGGGYPFQRHSVL